MVFGKFRKTFVVGRRARKIKRVFARSFKTDSRKPDFVVTYGGDGTILYAERLYPGIPKLAFRNHAVCEKCGLSGTPEIHIASQKVYCDSCLEKAIEKIKRGRFEILEFRKVEAQAFFKKKGVVRSKTLVGLNDVQIHNENHFHAVRFDFYLKGRRLHTEVIGDGVVVASVYGSTAYFRAISRKTFSRGFGIAFNNSLVRLKPIFLKGGFRAEARILRRNASLIADNNPEYVSLRKGDRVVFKPSRQKGRIIKLF